MNIQFSTPETQKQLFQFKSLLREWNKVSTKSSVFWSRLQTANQEIRIHLEKVDFALNTQIPSQTSIDAMGKAENAFEQLNHVKDNCRQLLTKMLEFTKEKIASESLKEWIHLQIQMCKKDLVTKEKILEDFSFGMNSDQLRLYAFLWALQPEIQPLNEMNFEFENE